MLFLRLEMVVISSTLPNPICNVHFSFVYLMSDLRRGAALTGHLDDERLHLPRRAPEEQTLHEHRVPHAGLLLHHHRPLYVRMSR